jgi:ABC-type proline/glycine betaine transport system permease subunit
LYLLFAINTLLGEGVVLFLAFVSLWLIVPLFFTPHGIFVRRQNAVTSLLGSFQLTRFTLPSTSLFVLTVFMLGIGLNYLWSIPASDSWLALVGILGHAFITTALLASSFIYYQDMSSWLQTVFARLRASAPTQQA